MPLLVNMGGSTKELICKKFLVRLRKRTQFVRTDALRNLSRNEKCVILTHLATDLEKVTQNIASEHKPASGLKVSAIPA